MVLTSVTVAIHELRHVLVAGGNHHRALVGGGLLRQGTDDVVRLDAIDDQQRQAQRTHDVVDRLNLRPQLIGHRRAVGFVTLEQVVAKGLALGVEDHGERAVRVVLLQPLQHRNNALDRTRGLTLGIGQRRQRMKGAIKVGGSVDEDNGRGSHRAQPEGTAQEYTMSPMALMAPYPGASGGIAGTIAIALWRLLPTKTADDQRPLVVEFASDQLRLNNLAYNRNDYHCRAVILSLRLSQLANGITARVTAVQPTSGADSIAGRLMELGFVAGEAVRVLATGPMGGEPLLVQVGYTRFALRRAEAARAAEIEVPRC